MLIRDATPDAAAAVAAIYNVYVASTCISFETDPVQEDEMRGRMAEATDSGLPWLLATEGADVLGYAYASKWKGRCAYRHSVESTVYVARTQLGRGVGRQLYVALIERLRGQGFHTAIGGIALPNERSVALHERLGFLKVAHFGEVGFKQERWIDVGYWQLMLAAGPDPG